MNILTVSVEDGQVTFDWNDTKHVYRLGSRSAHDVRNAIANLINAMFPNTMLVLSEAKPVVHSTGDAYEQGIEFGWRLATTWSDCNVSVGEQQPGRWTAYDEDSTSMIYDGPSFRLMRGTIDRWMKPKGASALQYEVPLDTLLRERNLTLDFNCNLFRIVDHNGALIATDHSLDVVTKLALERTAP